MTKLTYGSDNPMSVALAAWEILFKRMRNGPANVVCDKFNILSQ
jgi:hypothetical protein